MNKEIKLIRSRLYNLHSVRENQYFITNLLTGKIFGLEEIPYKIFTLLKKEKSVNEIINSFRDTDEESIISLLDYLVSQELIYDVTNPIDETFQISNQGETFFNVPKFYFNTKDENVVFAGIPFGKGNPISSATYSASSILRKYTSANKLDFSKGKDLSNLENILSVNADLTPLLNSTNDNRIKDIGDLFFYANEYTENAHAKINRLAAKLFKAKQKPIFIGGDHSITYPLLKAANDNFKNIIVIHLDAHPDTYENPLDIIFKGKASNHHGNFASLAQELPNIIGIYQFGIRGLSNVGIESMTEKQKIYYIKETKKIIKNEADIQFPEDACFYLTFDIDVLSPEIAPATATPVPNGLNFEEAFSLIHKLLKDKNIIGLDFVEFNHEKDINGISTQLCVEMLILFINLLCKN